MPDEDESAPSALAGAVRTALFAVAVAALVLTFMRVTVRPINPAQKAPTRHVPVWCPLCHTVSESAELVKE